MQFAIGKTGRRILRQNVRSSCEKIRCETFGAEGDAVTYPYWFGLSLCDSGRHHQHNLRNTTPSLSSPSPFSLSLAFSGFVET